MSDTWLGVPFRVSALRVAADRPVLGAPDFAQLPYVSDPQDGSPRRDVASGRPFLAEATHPPPFSPTESQLAAGVHLHFVLPRGLRTGRTASGANTFEFPPAPDRWLVVRRSTAGEPTVWRIDASYVWPPDDRLPDRRIGNADEDFRAGPTWPWRLRRDADGAPVFEVGDGTPPWRQIGITYAPDAGQWDGVAAELEGAETLPEPLTAAGWGDPTFAASYPACAGQFGFFDAEPFDNLVEYLVFGWYEKAADDPLVRLRAELASGADNNAVLELLRRRLGWVVTGAVPTRTVLVGRLSREHVAIDDASRTTFDAELAVAGSGAQALAVLLTGIQGGDVERQLEAVLFGQQLKGHTVDVGWALDDLVQRRSFAARGGGERWVIRGKPAEPPAGGGRASPRPDDDIELPEAVAADLDALNEAQESLDVADLRVAALREALFADWYRAIAQTDPTLLFALEWVEVGEHPLSADRIYRLIRQARLPQLSDALADRGHALETMATHGDRILAALDDHNGQPRAPQWELSPTPGSPFHAPSEPVVALLPSADAPASSHWRGEGLARDENGSLRCAGVAGVPTDVASVETLLSKLANAGIVLDPEADRQASTPLRMEWRAQFAARVSADADGAYPEDWLTRLPELYDEPVELVGTALVTDDATPQLRAGLLRYVRARLAERVLWVGEHDEALSAELCLSNPPPAGAPRSWLEQLGLAADCPDADLQSAIEAHKDALRDWFGDWLRMNTLLAAGADVAAWASAASPPGYPRSGPLRDAVATWLAGRTTVDALNLPSALAARVFPLKSNLDAVLALPDTRPGVIAAALLEGWDSTHRDRAFIHGLPDGGRLATAVVDRANTLDPDALLRILSFSDPAVATILEQRPFDDLDDLARLPAVDAGVVAALVADVERAYPDAATLPAAREPVGPAAVDPLAHVLDALVDLNVARPALVHTLDGFNDALLQWDPSPQLPVGDPMGFPDHQEFTDRMVRPAVATARRRAPHPTFPFTPLRAGALALTGLRLVDTFGRCRDMTPDAQASQLPLKTPTAWSGRHGDFPVELPPRLLQGARLRARWLDGDDPRREWTPHPGRTVLAGWLVADSLESELDLHDGDGALLGSLDAAGVWRIAPGRKGPATVRSIVQPGLRELAAALVAGCDGDVDSDHSAVAALIDDIDEALEDIHPDTNRDEQAVSLLLSRPLAVVHLSLALELEGPPVARMDPAALSAELDELERRLDAGEDAAGTDRALAADPRRRRRFERVRVPIDVGARHRLADGVVAWSEVLDGGVLGPLHRPHRSGDSALELVIDPAAPPRTLLLLVEPSAAIHLESPILPPVVLQLPPHAAAQAARARELLAYSGPHLTPRTHLHAPVIAESGWDTRMLILEPGRWLELGAAPLIDRAQLEARLDQVSGVWARLLRDGILVVDPGEPTLARLAPLPPPPAGQEAATLETRLSRYPNPAQLVAALHAVGRTYAPPQSSLAFGPLELREAFLALRPSNP